VKPKKRGSSRFLFLEKRVSQVETVKVKSEPSEDNPLGFIIINKSDFDDKKHELHDGAERHVATRSELDAALAELPGNYIDPDFVVNGMRQHFGDLFTAEDETKVRNLVKAPASKPSDGLTVEQLKAALAEKKIDIPAGMTLKAELQALLDSAAG